MHEQEFAFGTVDPKPDIQNCLIDTKNQTFVHLAV